jgi:riboflavin kinase/FMN adenylyltransferase
LETLRGTAALTGKLEGPVLTIGNFDGLHLGHRDILRRVVDHAQRVSAQAVVYTFEPHPRKVLTPNNAPRLLTTLDQKLELLAECGVDLTILEPFDSDFARVSPERFVNEYIHQRLDPVHVYVGYDFHYGRDREGSMRLLTETGPRLGFAVTIVPEVTVMSRDVNSTRIRELLAKGEVDDVAVLLGRNFAVRGKVVAGDKRGRTIGFPTANLLTENEVLPAPGVYTGDLRFLDDGAPGRGERWPVVSNVGYRPTFQDGQGLLAEAHLIDFEGDVYGRRVELAFSHRLREERTFADVDALREQIARDVELARKRLPAP